MPGLYEVHGLKINPFFTFPFPLELVVLLIAVLKNLADSNKISKKLALLNIILPGIGTIIVGGQKRRVVGCVQLVLFVLLLPYGWNNLITIGAWFWGIFTLTAIMKEKEGNGGNPLNPE